MYVSRGRRWPTETKRKSKGINPGAPLHKASHATRKEGRKQGTKNSPRQTAPKGKEPHAVAGNLSRPMSAG